MFSVLSPDMERTECRYHPEKDLIFFCCSSLICGVCKEEHHLDHDVQQISEVAKRRKEELSSNKARLEKSLEDADSILEKAESDLVDFEKSVECARELLNTKMEAIIKWAREYRENTDKEFDLLRQQGKKELGGPVHSLRKEVDNLRNQKEDLEKCLDSSRTDQYVFRYFTEFHKRNTQPYPKLPHFAQLLAKCKIRVVLNGSSPESVQSAIQEYLGMPVNIEMSPEAPEIPSMCLVPQFKAVDAPDCTITAILPLRDIVCVTYRTLSDVDVSSRLVVLTKSGRKLKEEQVFEKGQLQMIHLPSDKLLVYSSTTHTSKIVALGNQFDSRTVVPKEYFWSQTENGSHVIYENNPFASVHTQSRTLRTKISCKPVVLGVSHDGQHFAVVTESNKVMVYENGVDDAIMAVKPATDRNCPTSVCFHKIDNKLMLLVADGAWNLICVIDFLSEPQRVLGPLTLGCKLLTSPSALASDGKERVWIGCDNGMLLTCVLTETMLLEHPKLELQEDSDGYLTPLQIANMYVEIDKRQANERKASLAMSSTNPDDDDDNEDDEDDDDDDDDDADDDSMVGEFSPYPGVPVPTVVSTPFPEAMKTLAKKTFNGLFSKKK